MTAGGVDPNVVVVTAALPALPTPEPPPRRRRHLGVAAVAVVLAGALVVAGVVVVQRGGSSDAPPPFRGVTVTGRASTEAQLKTLLDERANAVMRKDEAAFLSTVNPHDAKDLRAQRLLFRNLTALPLTRYELSSLTPDMPRAPNGTWIDGFTYYYETLQIRGVDTTASIDFVTAKLSVVDGRLYVSPDQSASPWGSAPLSVVSRAHVVVAVTRNDAKNLDRIASVAEQAARATQQYWAPKWQRQFVVFASSNKRLVHKVWFGGNIGSDFEGYVTQVPDLDPKTTGANEDKGESRVVIDLDYTGVKASHLGLTLRHEFAHAASAHATKPRTPIWVIEGFAEQIGEHDAPLPRGGPFFVGLSLPRGVSWIDAGKFYTGDVQRHYAYSYLAFRYLAERYGDRRTRGFYVAAQGGGHALKKAWASLHTTEAAFVASWNRWAREKNLVL